RPVANVEPGLIAGMLSISKVARVGSTGRWVFGYLTARSGGNNVVDVILSNARVGAGIVELDFASRARWQTVDFGDNTFLSGALTSVYDGDRVTEVGFLLRPTKPGVASGLT